MHDARVALTGRNEIFAEKLYAVRPHILVLNKMDLIDMKKYKFVFFKIFIIFLIIFITLELRLKIFIKVEV